MELLALYWDTQTQANAISQAVARAREARRPATPASRPRVVQRRLDAAECQELVGAYQQGAMVTDLQTRFGVHRHTVTSVLKRQGVPLRQPGLEPDEVPEAIRLYESGLSLAKIAAKFGLEQRSIRRSLMQAGVTIRPPGRKPAT